jgi:hypothetical protein
MFKKILFPLFIFLVSCNTSQPPADTVKAKAPSKPKPEVSKPAPSPWEIRNYIDADGQPKTSKYGRYDTDGTFSNSTVSNKYMHAVIVLNKDNAGILLNLHKKSNPTEKFTGLVKIRLKNSIGEELEITSSRRWNKSGGILIEQKNNDYSQFRIFMLQSEGLVNVDILNDSSSVYRFAINAYGFSDALSQI